MVGVRVPLGGGHFVSRGGGAEVLLIGWEGELERRSCTAGVGESRIVGLGGSNEKGAIWFGGSAKGKRG